MNLTGKNVLITGASRRIGREIALTLALRGANLLIHYRKSKSEALALKKEIEKMGSRVSLIQADFSREKSFSDFLKKVSSAASRVDVLVNNASIYYPTPLGKISSKIWGDFLTVNLKAPFLLSQAVGQAMFKQESGKIINLVDWAGERPLADYLPYCISKAGLIAATKGLAKALAPHVQVVGIAPGPVLPAESLSKKDQEKAAERSLLKRYGGARDIAEAVRFCIEGTDFMTGSILTLDGGASLT